MIRLGNTSPMRQGTANTAALPELVLLVWPTVNRGKGTRGQPVGSSWSPGDQPRRNMLLHLG